MDDKMNQKGFINIILVIIVVVLAGAVSYFVLTRQINPPPSSNSISASPNPCAISSGQTTCSSTISWSTSGYPQPCIFVRETGGLFACQASGSQAATWITSAGFNFDLRSSNSITSPLLASVFVTAAAATKEIWLAPYPYTDPNDENSFGNFFDVFNVDAPWQSVKEKTHVFKFFGKTLLDEPEGTKKAVQFLNKAGIAIAVELGGLRDWECHGATMAEIELGFLTPLKTALDEFGGELSYIDLDDPFGFTISTGVPNPCQYTIEQAANELVVYMKKVKEVYPNVKFGLIAPVPWYSVGKYPNNEGPHYADLPTLLDIAIPILGENGLKFDFFHADSPYNYNVALPNNDGWKKLKALEDYLRSKGIRFGPLYNSETGGHTSNELSKPIIIQETDYNDLQISNKIQRARTELRLNIRAVLQWPHTRESTAEHFSMHYPPEFANFLNCTQNYTGTHNQVGLSNGDTRFVCFNAWWYDCGWEANDASWETKAVNGQVVGSWKCNLPTRTWLAN